MSKTCGSRVSLASNLWDRNSQLTKWFNCMLGTSSEQRNPADTIRQQSDPYEASSPRRLN